jgi:hypothetical protein
MIAPFSSGVVMDDLIADCDEALLRYTGRSEQLVVDLGNAALTPLETIWQAVLEQEKASVINRLKSGGAADAAHGPDGLRNQAIWQEVCAGDFSRKAELTALPADAAACLARWKEPDLFLNRLRRLEPAAAGNLLRWKGNWLCLNGVTELPPDSVRHLFQWEGHWISLNGLNRLPFQSSMYLARWKGKTLELMGLDPESMAGDPLALKHLAAWEKTGGQLFVPASVRELMGKIQ